MKMNYPSNLNESQYHYVVGKKKTTEKFHIPLVIVEHQATVALTPDIIIRCTNSYTFISHFLLRHVYRLLNDTDFFTGQWCS